MPPTDDQGSCDDSLHNRSSLDDVHQRPQSQPGANVLSNSEIKLCLNLNMPPTRYITLKTVLLSGSDHSYAIKKEPSGGYPKSLGGDGGSEASATNSSHIQCIKKYLTKAGWLAAGNWYRTGLLWLALSYIHESL